MTLTKSAPTLTAVMVYKRDADLLWSLFFLSYLVPSVITDIIAINQYVIWQPPIEKNGIITGYIMKVCRDTLCNVFLLGPATFVYEVQVSNIPSGTAIASVQVSNGSSFIIVCTWLNLAISVLYRNLLRLFEQWWFLYVKDVYQRILLDVALV